MSEPGKAINQCLTLNQALEYGLSLNFAIHHQLYYAVVGNKVTYFYYHHFNCRYYRASNALA